jgi:hypothetical protein
MVTRRSSAPHAPFAMSVVMLAMLVSACGAEQWTTVEHTPDPTTVMPTRPAFEPRPLATGCEQAAPPGASADARAYLAAVNAAYPGWEAVTRSLQEEGGRVSLGDLAAEGHVEADFLVRLNAIHFSPRAAAPAGVLRRAVQQYVDTLRELFQRPRPLDETAVPRLDELMADTSAELRRVLGLRQSSCDVLQP